MKKLAIAILFAGATSLMADGAAAYAKCVGCHGANGEKSALGKSAIIQGQDAAKTVEQLHGYKAGTLNQHGMGGLMKGQVMSMDDAAIQAVADYIAAMK
ncbi:MAG TPA: c-type cytochrome [Epsilonproteobacteria bacterium]|nr:c-type cytochrome [Campylobacterota bacterium]